MSIRKISKELGLSSATVSWILSGQGEERGFKEETIKRVKEYAKTINYTPNLVARNLSKGNSKTIGVIVPYISDTYFANIVQEIETEANREAYGLIICSSGGDEQRESRLVDTLLSQQVDGIIIAPANGDSRCIKQLEKRKCPFVLIDRYSDSIETNYVVSNNFKSGKELTLRMAKQGATKIAIVTSDSHLSSIQERLAGYKSALDKAKLSFDNSLIIDVDRLNYKDVGGAMVEKVLCENPDINGIFFATHYLALTAIKHFAEHNIDYNSRFKMATIFNPLWLRLLAPEINVSHVPIKEISRMAVDILCKNIKDKTLQTCQIVINNSIVL